ncbi:MAG: hypothetical protein EBR73_15930 [Rhodobacteraceae bacterium]|nr:hypothetical protein [Paracoccaceae bacterium]
MPLNTAHRLMRLMLSAHLAQAILQSDNYLLCIRNDLMRSVASNKISILPEFTTAPDRNLNDNTAILITLSANHADRCYHLWCYIYNRSIWYSAAWWCDYPIRQNIYISY